MYVTQKNSNSEDGFAFPYIRKDNRERIGVVVFAILNYDSSLQLISMKKLEISQYNDFLNKFKIDELTCEIHVIKKIGISFEEVNERIMNHLKKRQSISDKKSYKPVWKIRGKRIGIWKPTPTVKINNIKSLRYMLHRTYGNFGFM